MNVLPEPRAATGRAALGVALVLVALLAVGVGLFFLPLGVAFDAPGLTTPGDPGSTGSSPGVVGAQTGGFVRAFEVRYRVDDAAAFHALPSDADRAQVRAGLTAAIDPEVTHRTQFHVFPAHPTVDDLVAYIDANVLGPDLAVKAQSVMQEHVWRQGAWVCETRFTIVDADSGQDLSTTTTVQGTSFGSDGFWIAAYAYHAAP